MSSRIPILGSIESDDSFILLIFVITFRAEVCVACDILILTTFIPDFCSCLKLRMLSVAGPTVQIIFDLVKFIIIDAC